MNRPTSNGKVGLTMCLPTMGSIKLRMPSTSVSTTNWLLVGMSCGCLTINRIISIIRIESTQLVTIELVTGNPSTVVSSVAFGLIAACADGVTNSKPEAIGTNLMNRVKDNCRKVLISANSDNLKGT